jgi:hypothetical protein
MGADSLTDTPARTLSANAELLSKSRAWESKCGEQRVSNEQRTIRPGFDGGMRLCFSGGRRWFCCAMQLCGVWVTPHAFLLYALLCPKSRRRRDKNRWTLQRIACEDLEHASQSMEAILGPRLLCICAFYQSHTDDSYPSQVY